MSTHVIPHHFDNAEQAYQSSKLGFWLFLVSEILLFGGLFVAYIVFRSLYPDMFHEASGELNRIMGGINTIVLICSSFTMAMGVNRVQHNDPKKAVMFLAITIAFAAIFMVIKYFEYSHKIHLGLLPAGFYHYDGITHPRAPLFFSLYFVMTGLHGVHVLVGMGLITWVLLRVKRGDFSNQYYTPVELVGLYWHLVDLIWIYLFPLMYLIG